MNTEHTLPALLWGKAAQGGYQVLAQHPDFPAAAVAAVDQVREQFKQFPNSNGLSPHPPYVVLQPVTNGQGWVLVRIRDQGKDEFQRGLTLRLEAGWCAQADAEQLRLWLQDFPYWQVHDEADKPVLQLTTSQTRLQPLNQALFAADLQQPLLIGSVAPAFPANFTQSYIIPALQTPVTVQTVTSASKTETQPTRILSPTPSPANTSVKLWPLIAVGVLMLCLGSGLGWLVFSVINPETVVNAPPPAPPIETSKYTLSLTELKVLDISGHDYNTAPIPEHSILALQHWRANTWQLYRYLMMETSNEYLLNQLHREATDSIYPELNRNSANWPWLTEATDHERVLQRLQTVLSTVTERNAGLMKDTQCVSVLPPLRYQACVYERALTGQTVLGFLLLEWRGSVDALRDGLMGV